MPGNPCFEASFGTLPLTVTLNITLEPHFCPTHAFSKRQTSPQASQTPLTSHTWRTGARAQLRQQRRGDIRSIIAPAAPIASHRRRAARERTTRGVRGAAPCVAHLTLIRRGAANVRADRDAPRRIERTRCRPLPLPQSPHTATCQRGGGHGGKFMADLCGELRVL